MSDLEAALPRFFKTSRPKARLPLANYFRQYVGFSRRGRRLIYVNAFVDSSAGRHWKSEAVVVCDGGDGFFGVEYDIQAREFRNLNFNGMA